MRPLSITYLAESLTELWGGVKTVCMQAELLHRRGHAVRLLARSAPPAWMALSCPVESVAAFTRDVVPPSDLVVGTFVTTVPHAIAVRRGVPVHLCQGFEGDNPEYAAHRAWIEAEYRRTEAALIVIAPHLRTLMHERFGRAALEVPYAIDHELFFPRERPARSGPMRAGPLRIGMVGPAGVPWKDLGTGALAADLVWRAGLDLTLVRVSPVPFDRTEPQVTCPVERHARVPPAQMGDLMRSLDVFLGTSSGPEEGFFLPAVEAMACGIPCVLTDVPCFRGYDQPNDYALFAPPRDPARIADHLVTLATEPDICRRLSARGREVAGRYAWPQHLDALCDAFTRIAGSRTPETAGHRS